MPDRCAFQFSGWSPTSGVVGDLLDALVPKVQEIKLGDPRRARYDAWGR